MQAALSTVARDAVAARYAAGAYGGDEEAHAADAARAKALLTIAVVSIFATAPLFAGLIQLLGPRLLTATIATPPPLHLSRLPS